MICREPLLSVNFVLILHKEGQSELCSCSALAVIRVLLVEIDRTSEVSRGLDVFSLAYVRESKVQSLVCYFFCSPEVWMYFLQTLCFIVFLFLSLCFPSRLEHSRDKW